MNQDEINYDKVVTVIEKTVATSSFYWQSLTLIICFILSYSFYRLVRQFFLPKIISKALKRNVELNRIVTRYLVPMLYPTFALIFLSIGFSIYSQFYKETIIFLTTLKLVALFLFLRLLRISSNSNFIANTAGLFLMPALVLDIFDLLNPTIDFLDQYAFKIGAVRISVYLVMKAFVVVLIVFWFSNLVSRKSKSYIEGTKNIKSSTKNIISKLIDMIIYSIIAIILLQTFGVDTTTLAVIGGAVGVGIGFGLQKISSNFISGIILLFEKSVEIGDWIELDNGSVFGVVKHFGGRYTLIESFDGKEIMVPNEDFIVGRVTNWTYSNNRARIEINLGVMHGADLTKVKEVMSNCAKEHPRCLNYPEVECYVTQFADHDIKFTLFFWVSDIIAGRMAPKSEVMMNIWQKFRENNIQLSLPQRQVRVVDGVMTSIGE